MMMVVVVVIFKRNAGDWNWLCVDGNREDELGENESENENRE